MTRPRMDDVAADKDPKVSTLRAALRVARVEEAERAQAVADLHGIELSRLELLRDEIEPLLAQIPEGVEMFDAGLMPGPRPRLFIDMIAFVEMARDKRQYRFMQDRRHGRTILAESDRLDVMADAIAAYIARRLVEREKALASDPDDRIPLPPGHASASADIPADIEWAPERPRPPRRRERIGRLVVDYLGIVSLCVLGLVLWRYAIVYWPR
jgi:hypothetical protein